MRSITRILYSGLCAVVILGLTMPVYAAYTLPNPINADSPEELISNVIQVILGVTGSISLLMFVYGGFIWLTSAGNSERVSRGKNVFVWATIGLVVIFTSYVVLRTIFGIFN